MIKIKLNIVDDKGGDVGLEDFQIAHIVSWRAWETSKSTDELTVFYTTDRRRKLIKMTVEEFEKQLNLTTNE